MKTISEDKMDTEFNANEVPRIRNIGHAASNKYPATFPGKVESVEAKSNLELWELFKDFSDFGVLGSPAIFENEKEA